MNRIVHVRCTLIFLLVALQQCAGLGQYIERAVPFDPTILNHSFPETRDSQPVFAPIQYQAYFKCERALFDYYPRFWPGPLSFDPTGKPYVLHGSTIQYLDAQGQWQYRDMADVFTDFVIGQLGHLRMENRNQGHGNETTIRFDNDGDAYMLGCFLVTRQDEGTALICVLFHSRDNLQTWTGYQLPHPFVSFEQVDGHNGDCLSRPPVLLMSSYYSPCDNYITIPEKQPDGSLVIPTPVHIASNAVGFIRHSGDGNSAVTHGDKVFIFYSRMVLLDGYDPEDGVPAYAVTYDINTRAITVPVHIGFCGINVEDNHNWPSVTIDSNGILHVILNGHHDPFRYTYSTQPYSTASWTTPVDVSDGTTYATINCGPDDTLYAVTRCSNPGYYFRLTLHRKRPGQGWEPDQHLVIPFKAYYKNYFHKMTLNPANGDLYLSYNAQANQICVFKDEFLSLLHMWPDRERAYLESGPIPLGTALTDEKQYQFYHQPPSEPCILISGNGGNTWRLAVSADFGGAP